MRLHRLTADEQTLVLLDGYGLTRWGLPRKIKSDRKLCAGIEPVLLLSPTDDTLVVGGEHLKQFGMTRAHNFPALGSLDASPSVRAPVVFTPAGHLLSFSTDDPERPERVPELYWTTLHGTSRGRLTLLKPPEVPAAGIDLHHGDSVHAPYTRELLRIDRQGHFVLCDTSRRMGQACMWMGHADAEGQVEVTWSGRMINVQGATLLEAYPTGTSALVISWSAPLQQARVQEIGAAPSEVRVFDTIEPPTYARGTLAYQPDEDTVVVGEERFSISAVSAASAQTAKRPDFLAEHRNAGRGDLIVGRERALFIPWHRESFLDLRAAREIYRKLGPKRRPERVALSRQMKDAMDEMHQAGGYAVVCAFDGFRKHEPWATVHPMAPRARSAGAFPESDALFERLSVLKWTNLTGCYSPSAPDDPPRPWKRTRKW